MLTAAGGASLDSRWGVNLFSFLLVLFLLSLSVHRIALVVNLRACGLAFEDAATNPVTLSEERRERRKEV